MRADVAPKFSDLSAPELTAIASLCTYILVADLSDRVREAGIVGAGGAGFPTHVKFASQAEIVIANGAECEPLLKCDKAVMHDRTELVLEGLRLLAEATCASRAVVALKGHYADVVDRVRAVASDRFPDIEVFELGNYYPAGDEQILVEAVTGRVVPEGGIPLQVGTVVNNVITLSQVAQAAHNGEPVTRRPITVHGEVAQPLTCELPIGAPMALAVELAGGATVRDWIIVEGGPMMGRVIRDPNTPITKKTSGVIVLATDHPLAQRIDAPIQRELLLARVVCCQCRMCTDLCPRFNLGHDIQPHLAMRVLATDGIGEVAPDHVTAAYLCCLCGVCEVYACPLGLSPRKVYDEMRKSLSAAGQKNNHTRQDCVAGDFAEQRKIPIPRLVARLGLSDYADAATRIDWTPPAVPAVQIPLSQHLGAPARPVVSPGQVVTEGDLIAEIPEGKLGARVHASISGTVTDVSDHAIRIATT